MNETVDFYQISLKLLLQNELGQFLVLKGLDNGSFAGYYEFPGGRIDESEFNVPFVEILKRETFEELGEVNIEIDPTPIAIGRHKVLAIHTGQKIKDVPIFYVFFLGSLLSGDIIISDEHSGYEWVDLKTIELEKYFTSGILEGVRMYLNSK